MVNAQAEKVFGYERAEMLGQSIEMLVPERFRGQPPEAARRASSTSPSPGRWASGRDLYGLKKDGSEFPIEIGLNPIETDEGPMVLSAIVDISSRKRLEERFRQVVESAPNAMVMIGPAGKIEMVNAQAERLFGYDRAEMLGQAIEMLVPERFRGNHPKPAHRLLQRSRVAAHGRGPRPVRPEEGRQRVPHRDRPEPDRDRRRPDGALGHRRHLLPQAAGRALPPGGGVRAERHGDDRPAGKIEMVNAQAENAVRL